MPYLVRFAREDLDSGMTPRNAGELNYVLSTRVIKYIASQGLSYAAINDVIGALEGVKAEFQRRVVAPYEDRKAETNGDLPWPS